MRNIVTYAEDLLETFDAVPFNPVDSLILSWASYLHLPVDLPPAYDWRGIRFADIYRAECFDGMFRGVWDAPSGKKLLAAMAASPRYRDIRILGFTERRDSAQEKQFAAVSFQLTPGLCYIAFRGTDSTLLGWKEDFNMAFQYPVPAQEDAAAYLNEAARYCTGEIRVGGHSKGGNLAVYAAANSSTYVNVRIAAVYSHDGPGFLETALKSEKFTAIADRIDKTVPQSSLVGMLLEQQENYRIIRSTRVSFWQHDPFSWVVGEDDFDHMDTLTPDAVYIDRTVSQWLESIPCEQRELFVDSLYELVNIENITTVADLRADWRTNLPTIAHGVSNLDPATRKFLMDTVRSLAALSIKNFPEMLGAPLERGKQALHHPAIPEVTE